MKDHRPAPASKTPASDATKKRPYAPPQLRRGRRVETATFFSPPQFQQRRLPPR